MASDQDECAREWLLAIEDVNGVYAYENPAPSMLAVCKAVDNCVCEGRIDENPG
jgi:hypothetical protein